MVQAAGRSNVKVPSVVVKLFQPAEDVAPAAGVSVVAGPVAEVGAPVAGVAVVVAVPGLPAGGAAVDPQPASTAAAQTQAEKPGPLPRIDVRLQIDACTLPRGWKLLRYCGRSADGC